MNSEYLLTEEELNDILSTPELFDLSPLNVHTNDTLPFLDLPMEHSPITLETEFPDEILDTQGSNQNYILDVPFNVSNQRYKDYSHVTNYQLPKGMGGLYPIERERISRKSDVEIVASIKRLCPTFTAKRLVILEQFKDLARKNRYYPLALELVHQRSNYNYIRGGIEAVYSEYLFKVLNEFPELIFKGGLISINDDVWKEMLKMYSSPDYAFLINMEPIHEIMLTMRLINPLIDPTDPKTFIDIKRDGGYHISNSFIYQNDWVISGCFLDDPSFKNIMNELKNATDISVYQIMDDINFIKRRYPHFSLVDFYLSERNKRTRNGAKLSKSRSQLSIELRKLPLVYTSTKHGTLISSKLLNSVKELDVPDYNGGVAYTNLYSNGRDLVNDFFYLNRSYGKYNIAMLPPFIINLMTYSNSKFDIASIIDHYINEDSARVMLNVIPLIHNSDYTYKIITSTEVEVYHAPTDPFISTIIASDRIEDDRNLVLYI
ncbi:hypothetical protein D3C87_1024720 [compost metagenome]